MRHITVTVQDDTYREIRAWCAKRDTCVSHVVQAFLADLPRLASVHSFPLPSAPDPASLGDLYPEYRAEIEAIQRSMSSFKQAPLPTVSLSRGSSDALQRG